jgi:hypothetical protein
MIAARSPPASLPRNTGAPEVDGEQRRRLLELLSMVEGEAPPETKSP